MTSSVSDSTSPTLGQFVRLDAVLQTSRLGLGPGWAVVCGVMASGRFTWSGRGLLLAGLAIFLADGVWATLWAAIVETNWAAMAARWHASPPPLRQSRLPYVQSGAPGDRAARWLAHLASWWQADLQPLAGSTVSSSLIGLALGSGLSVILGWPTLALSGAALALIQIGLVVNRASGQPVPVVKAILQIGLAWLAGHVAFGPLSWLSVFMAAAFTTTYAGGLSLLEQPGGLAAWRWPQWAAAALLFITRHPLAALTLLFTSFAQLLLEPALTKQARDGAWFIASSQAWLMIAMAIAALTIR
jgi:hypothetical protein